MGPGKAKSGNGLRSENGEGLSTVLARLERQYGAGTVMRMGDRVNQPVSVISSGSVGLDRALGVGGYPAGRVVEIYGPESSGKTTLTLHAIASCQAAGGLAAFVDAEHALDPTYARKLGVDVDALLVSQPDDGEQALDVVESLVSSGEVSLVVVDSVAALVPRAELDGEIGDQQVGLQARLMSKCLRRLTGVASRTGCCVMFINQLRQKIGVTFGPSEVTSGGNALKYYCSMRLDVRRVSAVKAGNDAVGNLTRVKVVKNKLAPPFRQVEFEILFGQGVSRAGELIDLGLEAGFVVRSGAWYSLGETRIGQGNEASRAWLDAHPVEAGRLYARLLESTAPGLGFAQVESAEGVVEAR
jgi:recombination protein RecA